MTIEPEPLAREPEGGTEALGDAESAAPQSRAEEAGEVRSAEAEAAAAPAETNGVAAAGPQEPIPDRRYFRIGEVSRITGVKPHVLRYWESEFRWMAPQKSKSKQRLYRRRDIEVILLIKKLLYEQRFTIAGARKKLRELGMSCALEEGALRLESDDRARFRRLREELLAIRALL